MKRNDPTGTLPIFDTATTAEGLVVAAGRFRCGLCNTMGVDEAGELCAACAATVLTSKRRYTRKPATATAKKVTTGKPRKATTRKATTRTSRSVAARDAG